MFKEVKPQQPLENLKYLNKLDEYFGFMCIHISRVLLFYIYGLKTPREVWKNIESLLGKQDEIRMHIIENEVIYLEPNNLESVQQLFSKFKYLVMQCKQGGIEKNDEQLVFSIMSKFGSKFFVFVSTFRSRRLNTPNQKTTSLNASIESLIQEQDNLIHTGTLKSSKDLSLLDGETKNA